MVLTREAQADGMDPISLEPYQWRGGVVMLSDDLDLTRSYNLIVSLDTYRRMLASASPARPMMNPMKQGVLITSAHALDGHGRSLFELPLQPTNMTVAKQRELDRYLEDMRIEPEGAYTLDPPVERHEELIDSYVGRLQVFTACSGPRRVAPRLPSCYP